MLRSIAMAAVAALGGCCAAPAVPTEPPTPVVAPPPTVDQCITFIPGVDNYGELGDEDFMQWIAQFGTVDYRGSSTGWWADDTGQLIGWSAQEDSTLCVLVWPGWPATSW